MEGDTQAGAQRQSHSKKEQVGKPGEWNGKLIREKLKSAEEV